MTIENCNECDGKECEDLRLLYQLVVQDIAFYKKQQWAVTNYSLLLDASVVGITRLIEKTLTSCESLVLSLIATAATGIAIYILHKLNGSLALGRKRLKHIRGKLTRSFEESLLYSEKSDEPVSIHFLLLTIIIVGITAVWWLLLCKL